MVKIDINKITNDEDLKYALSLIEWVINEQEFRDYILNFKNSYGEHKFLQTKNDNRWHLNSLIFESENKDGTLCYWDFEIKFFESDTEITGFVEPNKKVINLNSKRLNRSMASICKTILHEYCHIVGMTHSLFEPKNGVWKETAPYAISEFAEFLIARKLGDFKYKKPTFKRKKLTERILYKLFGKLS